MLVFHESKAAYFHTRIGFRRIHLNNSNFQFNVFK